LAKEQTVHKKNTEHNKKCITVWRNYTKYNYENKAVNAQLCKHTKLLYSKHKVYSTSRLHIK